MSPRNETHLQTTPDLEIGHANTFAERENFDHRRYKPARVVATARCVINEVVCDSGGALFNRSVTASV